MITVVFEPEKYRDNMDALVIADKVQKIFSEYNGTEYNDKFKKLMDEIDFFADNQE